MKTGTFKVNDNPPPPGRSLEIFGNLSSVGQNTVACGQHIKKQIKILSVLSG